MGYFRQEVGGGWVIPPNYCSGSNHGWTWHVHRHNVLGMQTGTSLECSTHAHVLSTLTTPMCVGRHASALTLNFHCCSSLIQALSMTISTPTGGQKAVAGCTPAAYREHCKRVFELPATAPEEIIPNPDPTCLPFLPDCIHEALDISYKGNKSSGPSLVLTQMIKHLHSRNDGNLSRLFHRVTKEGIL